MLFTLNIRTRTKAFKSSFYPNCLSEWDRLEPYIRLSSSINILKGRLFSIIRPPSKFVYRIHDPQGLSILTQLRVGLSKLNIHKFKHNFRETLNPLCVINDGVEDTKHYFLLCHTYDVFRRDLLNSVNTTMLSYGIICLSNEELLKVIHYCHEQLSFDSNARLLRATPEYIQTSKRFE